MFKVVTGKEPIKVIDLNNDGEAFFELDEKLEAYKHAAWIKHQGHNYRIEFNQGGK